MFLFIREAKLENFADDNTIYAGSNDLSSLLELLENESNSAVKWFKNNNMIVNPEKFQAMILGQRNQEKHHLKINNQNIEAKTQVTLLGLVIDKELNFDNYLLFVKSLVTNKML